MIKYTGKNGKEYILRFDMSAMEAMKEEFSGGYVEGVQTAQTGNVDKVEKLFRIMATAGEEYMAEKERREPVKVDTTGLISKHSSPGRVKGIMKAIEEAIADGNQMQTSDEEDDTIRDGYLEEYRQMEREKGN